MFIVYVVFVNILFMHAVLFIGCFVFDVCRVVHIKLLSVFVYCVCCVSY